MAKKSKNGASASDGAGMATADDLKLAEKYIPSARKAKGWQVAGTLGERFANPALEKRLLAHAKELTTFGLDVTAQTAIAKELALILPALARLDETAGRLHQRAAQLNLRATKGQTILVRVAKAAAPGTALAKDLQAVVGLRGAEVAKAKRARTNAKKVKSPPKTP